MRISLILILIILVKHVLRWRLAHHSCPLITFFVITESLLHIIVIALLLC